MNTKISKEDPCYQKETPDNIYRHITPVGHIIKYNICPRVEKGKASKIIIIS
jgi:hypothetical protein